MEENTSVPSSAPTCPQCHQPVLPEAYFCPNCGKSLKEKPLSTSVSFQVGLYAFSIILPIIAFIGVTRWAGIKYMKSNDPTAKQIGIVALVLLILSTVITYWLGVVWLQGIINTSTQGLLG